MFKLTAFFFIPNGGMSFSRIYSIFQARGSSASAVFLYLKSPSLPMNSSHSGNSNLLYCAYCRASFVTTIFDIAKQNFNFSSGISIFASLLKIVMMSSKVSDFFTDVKYLSKIFFNAGRLASRISLQSSVHSC